MGFLKRDSDAREWLVMAVIALLFFTLQWTIPLVGGYSELANIILIFGILVLGFDIFVGLTGYLSFGHAAFYGGGAYICALSLANISSNALVAMLIAIVCVTLVAFLIGLVALRRQGIYFAILTLAFAEMFYFLAFSPLQRWTNGDNGYTGAEKVSVQLFGLDLSHSNLYYFIVLVAVLAVFVARQIKRSPYGLMLRAIKSNETRLTYTGIDLYKYKVMAFTISGAFGGLAGSLFAVYERYVPVESLHWPVSGEVVIMSVIGGFGTLIGPMIGAGIVLYLENVLSAITGEWGIILGAIFMSFVIFLRGGVMDLPRGARKLIENLQAGPATGLNLAAFIGVWIAIISQLIFENTTLAFIGIAIMIIAVIANWFVTREAN